MQPASLTNGVSPTKIIAEHTSRVWERTSVTFANDCIRHGFLDLVPTISTSRSGCLCTCHGDMSFPITLAAAYDFALRMSALELLVSRYRGIHFCIGTEGASSQICHVGQAQVRFLLAAVPCKRESFVHEFASFPPWAKLASQLFMDIQTM